MLAVVEQRPPALPHDDFANGVARAEHVLHEPDLGRRPVVRVIECAQGNREEAARSPDDQTDALLTAMRAAAR